MSYPPDTKHARASDAVYETLRNGILDSTLAPGQRIESSLISSQMGISRMPVKQALDRLAAEGLLIVRPSKGTFVARPSLNTTNEAFEVRIALELLGAARMMERLTPEKLIALEEALQRLEDLPDEADVVAHMRENERLHTLMVEFSENKTLLDMYRRLRAHIQIAQIHYRSPEWQSRRDQERSEHRAMLEAIRSDDAAMLAGVLKQHLERARTSLLDDIGRGQDDGGYPSAAFHDESSRRRRGGSHAQYLNVGASEIAYWQAGDGPDIVLLHGYACTSEDWVAVARSLSRRWRVTRFDFPGHGVSRGPAPTEIEDLVDATQTLVARLCGSTPILVGHSMGGMVALGCILADPSVAAGLVLADAFPNLELAADVLGSPEDESDPFGYGSVLDRETPLHVESFVRAEMSAGAPRAGTRLFDSLLSFDARPRLPEISQKVLLLLGDRRVVQQSMLPDILKRLGLAHLAGLNTILLDSHHFVMLEQPEAVARAIDAFASESQGMR